MKVVSSLTSFMINHCNEKIIFFVKVVFDEIYFIVHYLSTLSFSTYLLKIY